MERWVSQGRRWGLVWRRAEAANVARADGVFTVRAGRGGEIRSRAVLWCTGTRFRNLGVPGEERLRGHGVQNIAPEDLSRFGRRTVAIVGGGEVSVQQAIRLSHRVAEVHLISRSPRLKAHRLLLRRIADRPNVVRHPRFIIERLIGRRTLEALVMRPAARDGAASRLPVSSLCVLIGQEPARVPAAWRRPPRGFFIAGDAAGGTCRQVAVAGGDGVRAAMGCIRYLEDGWEN